MIHFPKAVGSMLLSHSVYFFKALSVFLAVTPSSFLVSLIFPKQIRVTNYPTLSPHQTLCVLVLAPECMSSHFLWFVSFPKMFYSSGTRVSKPQTQGVYSPSRHLLLNTHLTSIGQKDLREPPSPRRSRAPSKQAWCLLQ